MSGGVSDEVVVSAIETDAMESSFPFSGPEGFAEDDWYASGCKIGVVDGGALHVCEPGTDQEGEDDLGRYWVAGKPEHWRTPPGTEQWGASGLDSYSPEINLAFGLHNRADVIGISHADAAAGDD